MRRLLVMFGLGLVAALLLVSAAPRETALGGGLLPIPDDIATGTYVGNGHDHRVISGVSFVPNVVIIMTEGSTKAVFRTSTMAGDASKLASSSGPLQPNLVESLQTGGFIIGNGSPVNKPGARYHWVALQAGIDDPNTVDDPNVLVGQYIGNGLDNRSIVTGSAPKWVVTLGDGAPALLRPGEIAGDQSFYLAGAEALPNRIQALEATGFQIGSSADVNALGRVFHYFVLNDGPHVTQGEYDGKGGDNLEVDDPDVRPAFVWVKRLEGSRSQLRTDTVVGDKSLVLDGSAPGPNRIQGFSPAGFIIGTAPAVNNPGDHYLFVAIEDPNI